MRRSLIVLVLAAVIFAACGSSSPTLDWSIYNHNCGANTDCIPIAVATTCECPLCDTRAINQSDEADYQKALQQYQAACKGTACSNIACPTVTAYCDNGTCQVH